MVSAAGRDRSQQQGARRAGPAIGMSPYMNISWLLLAAALLLGPPPVRASINKLAAPPCSLQGQLHNSSSWASHDIRHMEVASAAACELECCKVPECGGFTFAPSVSWDSSDCPLGSACCFLKDLATGKGQLIPVANATSGLVHGGRHPGPLPPPPPPRPPSSCGGILEIITCEQANLRNHSLRCWWNESHCVAYPIGPKGGGSCSSSTDCFGSGDCVSGGCRCDATWTGPHCKHLHLLPVEARRPGFPVNGPGPTNPSLPTDSSFTWGGAMAEEGGLYHLFFTEWINHCPMTFNTFYTSTHIAHVTSPTPLGPWTRVGVAVPPAAGNPTITKAPDGTWLLYFTNHRYEGYQRNCTGPVASWGPPASPGSPSNRTNGKPFGISLAHAQSLGGPWTIRYDVITVAATNPGGPIFLENGTLLMPFQTFPKDKPWSDPECVTIVTARSWDDFPYHTYPLGDGDGYSKDRSSCIERFSSNPKFPCDPVDCPPPGPERTPGSVEDPSNMWRDKRGNIHVLLHQSHKGGRAWSENNGSSWHYSYNATSYPFSPMADDGTVISCLRTASASRGEPRVLIDPSGRPSVLSTVCFTDDGPAGGGFYSRVLLQRINTLEPWNGSD